MSDTEVLLQSDLQTAEEDELAHLYTGDEEVDAPRELGREPEEEYELPEDGGPV